MRKLIVLALVVVMLLATGVIGFDLIHRLATGRYCGEPERDPAKPMGLHVDATDYSQYQRGDRLPNGGTYIGDLGPGESVAVEIPVVCEAQKTYDPGHSWEIDDFASASKWAKYEMKHKYICLTCGGVYWANDYLGQELGCNTCQSANKGNFMNYVGVQNHVIEHSAGWEE